MHKYWVFDSVFGYLRMFISLVLSIFHWACWNALWGCILCEEWMQCYLRIWLKEGILPWCHLWCLASKIGIYVMKSIGYGTHTVYVHLIHDQTNKILIISLPSSSHPYTSWSTHSIIQKLLQSSSLSALVKAMRKCFRLTGNQRPREDLIAKWDRVNKENKL